MPRRPPPSIEDARRELERLRHENAQTEAEKERLRRFKGPRRFHYREPEGLLPFLEVSDDVGRRLESGELALVAKPVTRVWVVPRDVAAELDRLRPEVVLHLPGRPAR